MSLQYRSSDGTETPVAGLAPAGQLVPSVSLYQTGTYTGSLPVGYSQNTVIFSEAMPDTDYIVTLSTGGSYGSLLLQVLSKTRSGFVFSALNENAGQLSSPEIKWQAFKLMTNEDRTLDEVKIAQNTANFAPAFSTTTSYAVGDYVTYNNILYRCTTAHTAGVWVAGHFTQVTVGGTLGDIVPSGASSINKLVTVVTAAGDNTTAAGTNVASTWRIISNGSLCICHGVNTEAFNTSAISMTSMQLPSGYVFDGVISANVFIDGNTGWVTGASHVSGNGAGTYITGSGLVPAGSFRQIVFAHKS